MEKAKIMRLAQRVLDNGIWYFNRFGVVIHLWSPSVSIYCVSDQVYGKTARFPWEDLDIKWFLSEKKAQECATEYRSNVLSCVPIRVLKRICRLKTNDHIYVKTESGKVVETELTFPRYSKHQIAMIAVSDCEDSYDDDVYPLSQYGKLWAITKEELL